MSRQARPRVLWRLRVLMAERDIRTTRELRRRLESFGVTISEPQLGRIVKGLPRQLNTEHLSALCEVLDATPGDLLQIPGRTQPTSYPRVPAGPTVTPAASPAKPERPITPPAPTFDPAIGPTLSAFHKPNP
jgi:DNA-binding Xre family transcriptional regulator